MTHTNREIPRPTCHGEEEPAVLASADHRSEMYRFLSEEAPCDAPLTTTERQREKAQQELLTRADDLHEYLMMKGRA